MNTRASVAAAALGVSRATLYVWTQKRLIPADCFRLVGRPGSRRAEARYSLQRLAAAGFDLTAPATEGAKS